MLSRYVYAGIFLFLIIALVVCAVNARRHHKELGKAVSNLDLAFIPPILGNAIIVIATRKWLALVGCYIYFIGMNLAIYEMVKFTEVYCKGIGQEGRKAPRWIKWLLLADAVQLLVNLFTKHAFDIKWIVYEGKIFYVLKPLAGQYIHRIVDYGIFIAVIVVYAFMTFRASRFIRERYSII